MANVYHTNFALQSANHAFSAIWKLTRALKKAGWAYKNSGDGMSKDTTGTASNDKWGASADPSDDTYPTGLDSVAGWWNAQGPTTLKLSMTSAPTGTFIRGETVTQATSGAEGEFLGYDFDATGSQGHAVILPRTGTFDASNVVTGAISGATFTPTALRTFVMEVVFWKSASNTTQGSMYIQRVSNEDENASRFSVLATQTGCTASVAPGGAGTNNAFPSAGSYVACGANISGSITHSNWFNASTNLGRAQIVATSCAGASGASPDGTFWVLLGDASTSTQAQFFSYMRMENGEEADLDPFVTVKLSSVGYSSANLRVDATGTSSLSGNTLLTGLAANYVAWRGWRRRGFASSDAFAPLTTAGLIFGFSGSNITMSDNLANPETVASAYTSQRVLEPFVVLSASNANKVRKGNPRWMWIIQGGTTFDTWDGKTKLCICPAQAQSTYPAVIVGPYDGSSTPLQA